MAPKRDNVIVKPSKALPPVPLVEEAGNVPEVKSEETSSQVEKIWEFVKNINTQEEIPFKDGSKYKFPATRLLTADKELAEKLMSVADRHAIILVEQQSIKE